MTVNNKVSAIERAKELRRAKESQFEKRRQVRIGYLGDGKGNAASNLYVPENPAFVWVRDSYQGTTVRPHHARINSSVRPQINLPVEMVLDQDGFLRITGISDTFLEYQGSASAVGGVAAHHTQHEWGGGDEIAVTSQIFMPGLAKPQTTPDMTVYIMPFVYTDWGRWPGGNTKDLTEYVPSSGRRFVTISIDPEINKIVYQPGNDVPSSLTEGTFESIIQQLAAGGGGSTSEEGFAAIPPPAGGLIPIAAILFSSTTTKITWNEIYPIKIHVVNNNKDITERIGAVEQFLGISTLPTTGAGSSVFNTNLWTAAGGGSGEIDSTKVNASAISGVPNIDSTYVNASAITGNANVNSPFVNASAITGVPNIDSSYVNASAITGDVESASLLNTFRGTFNGQFVESIDFLIDSSGSAGTITGVLNPTSGSVLNMVFSDGITLLPTPASVALTAGASQTPQVNYIYINQASKVLEVDTTFWPSGQHIKVAKVIVRDATTTEEDGGALVNQNWNDHIKGTNEQGHLLHISERLRQENSKWLSGTLASAFGTPGDLYISTTTGSIYQLHRQTFPAWDMSSGSKIHIVNHNTDPYIAFSNLSGITLDSNGNTLNNKYFSFVVWGIQNKTGEQSHVMLNLPDGTYNTSDDAVNDPNNFSVYTIPTDFKSVGFLIARFTLRRTAAAVWTIEDTQDLRGNIPSNAVGGAGGGLGDFLPLTGGSLTGKLFVDSSLETSSSVIFQNTVDIASGLSANSTLWVGGNASLNSSLYSASNAQFDSNLIVGGNASVTNLYTSGTADFVGAASFSNSVHMASGLSITALHSTGNINSGGNFATSGTAYLGGATSILNVLNAQSSASFWGPVFINGGLSATTIYTPNSLTVDDEFHSSAAVSMVGPVSIGTLGNTSLSVVGNVHVVGGTTGTSIMNQLFVGNNLIATSPATFNSTLNVAGNASVNDLWVAGAASTFGKHTFYDETLFQATNRFVGAASFFGATLYAASPVLFGNTLTVDQQSIFHGAVSAQSLLYAASALIVEKSITANSHVHINNDSLIIGSWPTNGSPTAPLVISTADREKIILEDSAVGGKGIISYSEVSTYGLLDFDLAMDAASKGGLIRMFRSTSIAGDARLILYDATSANVARHNFYLRGGYLVGPATGGDKGIGTINLFSDIYKNNTAYTNPDYVLEQFVTGSIVKFANNPGAKDYEWMELEQVETHIKETYRLPRVAAASGMFERGDVVLEKLEELYIHVIKLNKRVKELEAQLEDK